MRPILSKKRSQVISSAILLVGFAILVFTNAWWPGIMLVLGAALAVKQFLRGRILDMGVSIAAFGGFFVISQFQISWQILVPILLIFAAVYIVCKEWVVSMMDHKTEEEINIEIEEENDT